MLATGGDTDSKFKMHKPNIGKRFGDEQLVKLVSRVKYDWDLWKQAVVM